MAGQRVARRGVARHGKAGKERGGYPPLFTIGALWAEQATFWMLAGQGLDDGHPRLRPRAAGPGAMGRAAGRPRADAPRLALRACLQERAADGAPAHAIMTQGRWKTARMVEVYTHAEEAGRAAKWLA